MRLWSLHPRYLDGRGLVACWREALLAQAVLAGRTRGYTRHPQLERFRDAEDPLGALGVYLSAIADEGDRRSYRFSRERILVLSAAALVVTDGQLRVEWDHLMAKLRVRSPEVWRRLKDEAEIEAHPLFVVVAGPVASWERTDSGSGKIG